MVEKIAFSVLNKMALVWSTHGAERQTRSEAVLDRTFQDIFGRFVIEHLSRVCFEVPSKASFNSNDAQSRLVCPGSDRGLIDPGACRNRGTSKVYLRNERGRTQFLFADDVISKFGSFASCSGRLCQRTSTLRRETIQEIFRGMPTYCWRTELTYNLDFCKQVISGAGA